MIAQAEFSVVDLARQALLAAQETAKRNGAASRKPKRRTGPTVRRDGREPLGFGAATGIWREASRSMAKKTR
ncbi:hypothetical protein [Streptomyces xanthochromogenes]|uniref:hypothetical protein n=1 Tax=Streptomyces xanthochromogenes TaxID=67384 RepID=UPI002F3F0552